MFYEFAKLWPYVIGYGFALFIGQICIGKIAECMYAELGIPNRERAWHSMVLGSIERVLFIASLQAAMPGFIAVWLGLKTAGGWKHWTEEYWEHKSPEGQTIKVLGRHTFNIFLVAQALSIAFAGVGWKLIEWLSDCAWVNAGAIGLGSLAGVVVLLFIVKRESKRKRSAPNPPMQPTAGSGG